MDTPEEIYPMPSFPMLNVTTSERPLAGIRRRWASATSLP